MKKKTYVFIRDSGVKINSFILDKPLKNSAANLICSSLNSFTVTKIPSSVVSIHLHFPLFLLKILSRSIMTSNNSITTNKIRQDLKVALVHDFLNQYGGAERVLKRFTRCFPRRRFILYFMIRRKMRGKFKNADIRTSFFQKFPKFLKKRPKWLLPFLPTAPETFNLRDFDLVISSSGAWSKGIIVKPKTMHICYCHSPMRFAWDWNEKYLGEQGLGRSGKFSRGCF